MKKGGRAGRLLHAGARHPVHVHSNLSSTAPQLALEAFFANLASTPRV
jgi:hypothetical protein